MIDQLKHLNKLTSLLDLIGQLQLLIKKIDDAKEDKSLSLEERKARLKKFREQISVISQQVDTLKKEINLLTQYKVN